MNTINKQTATILQFRLPLRTYIVEGYKQGTGQVRFKVEATTIEQAWYKADIIADDNLLESWLVWRLDTPEPREFK